MRKIYLVKKNPEQPADGNNWLVMNSFEFMNFIQTPEGQKRRDRFGQLDACSVDDVIIIAECGAETAKQWRSEKDRHNYLASIEKQSGMTVFSYNTQTTTEDDKLSIVEKPELNRSPAYLTMKDKAGMPTRYNNAKKAIDEAIAMSRNLRQFQYELGVMGYHSNFSPNRKYATVTPKGSEKPIRTYRLGEEYTKEKIIERLTANRDSIVFKPFQPKTYIIRQYRLPTRENKIQKVGGLYGLYLYYCYRLGYLPKYNQKQQNTARLHYLLKDDLMKLDELTKQVTLLGKHQIGTDEQLFSYKRSVEAEIKTLTADRTHLRNEIRKVDISDERLSAAKMKISAISERLKELRKEVKLCDGIAKRSGVIADTLSQVKAEEEKSQRKESRNYEQRR